ncbi:phosphotransferase enzyme family protein [Nocardia rhizosphaerihabitans]|uniref:phosphotransferase enzyme family protein n=1 Tax=Nocardia rhizosphaerihabitans TaxID=1691570 RepID=UPI0036720797
MNTTQVERIARAACADADIGPAGILPIKVAENAIFRVPDQHVVIRVARAGQEHAARRELQTAAWLQAHNVSAVQPMGSRADFATIESRPVTLWKELPPHRNGTEREIGSALRALHKLRVPPFLSKVEPFVRLEQRIDSASSLSESGRQWLYKRLADLRIGWEELPSGMPRSPIHGDAWEGNVVTTDAGVTTFLDLERASVGPPEWDLVSTAIKHSSFRWISAERYGAFCDAYGYDVTAWDGFQLLRDIRELRMTCMAAQAAGSDPKHVAQAQLRVDCLRGVVGPRPWAGWQPIV